MKMKVLDHVLLEALNESSIHSGRSQNLRPQSLQDGLAGKNADRYVVNEHVVRQRNGQEEVRLCVVLDIYRGNTAWLDISADEFARIPELDLSDIEWETAMCAGQPPAVA